MGVATTILSILGLVSSALQGVLTGGAAKTDEVAANLVEIAKQAAAAYQQHTGQPIDPTVLQPIAKV